MRPLLDQSHLRVPWHAGQYQALPRVYVQNSALEIAWTRVVQEFDSREGKVIAPFLTQGAEGFSIDYETDWYLAGHMIAKGAAVLPEIDREPFGKLEE
jgi:N-acylneuraminate cytidylyltransferase